MAKKTIRRSSKTGKLVSKEFAVAHPATTETEVVEVSKPSFMEFADLNTLKDKINEIIAFITRS